MPVEVLIIAFVATLARFALDPIGWLTIAGGAIIRHQIEKWTALFLLSGVMTLLNAFLIYTANNRGIPFPRLVFIFLALTVLAFIGYGGMHVFRRLSVRDKTPQ
jgi:hypothetical protein